MCNSPTAKELNLKFNQLYRRQCNLYHTYAAACHLSDTAFPFFTASVKQKQMNIPHHLLSTSWLSFAACRARQ